VESAALERIQERRIQIAIRQEMPKLWQKNDEYEDAKDAVFNYGKKCHKGKRSKKKKNVTSMNRERDYGKTCNVHI
jgi:hypothetical protein